MFLKVGLLRRVGVEGRIHNGDWNAMFEGQNFILFYYLKTHEIQLKSRSVKLSYSSFQFLISFINFLNNAAFSPIIRM